MGTLILCLLGGLATYTIVGFFMALLMTSAGGEKFTLDPMTIKFIFMWPGIFFNR